MELILLPGNNKGTKAWAQEIKRQVRDLFDIVEIQSYNHWKTGGDIIDLDYELRMLYQYLNGRKDYILFGKSAGVLLALKGIYEKKLSPDRCMFLGLPFNWAIENGFPIEKWLKNFKTKALFVQKTSDPAMGYQDLKDLLKEKKASDYELIEVEGNDHDYKDICQIKELMAKLLKFK